MLNLYILYDGWPLVHAPLSPPAVHLLEILAALPEAVQATIALPADPPAWLPAGLAVKIVPTADALAWEQRQLPRLAKSLGADLIHLTRPTPSFSAASRTLISPAGYGEQTGPPGFRTRLGAALARGGLERARGLLWPADLPDPVAAPRTFHLTPRVPPTPPASPALADLPGDYYLFHGPPDERTVRRALQAWTWAAGPVGDVYRLIMAGLDNRTRTLAGELIKEYQLGETVIVLPAFSPLDLPPLYQAATAIFHPAEASPWGGAVRHALACGKPVVGIETLLTSALAGPAAYLAPAGDTRGLGAALISVVVKESLLAQLETAAGERRKLWGDGDFGGELMEIYRAV